MLTLMAGNVKTEIMLTELMVILEAKFTTLYPLSTLTASYFESESLEELETLFHNLCICHYDDDDDDDVT